MFYQAQRSRTSYLFGKTRLLATRLEDGQTEWRCTLCGWRSGRIPTFGANAQEALSLSVARHQCNVVKPPVELPKAA